MWSFNGNDEKAYAYDLVTLKDDVSKDLDFTDAQVPKSLWSDGQFFWLAYGSRIKAYLPTGQTTLKIGDKNIPITFRQNGYSRYVFNASYVITDEDNGPISLSDIQIYDRDSNHITNPDDTPKPELLVNPCLLYTSPSPRDRTRSRMPSSA